MKKYAELNLKKIREDNGLDFAHFTYVKGMCSCCYGPTDLPAIYWKDGIVKNEEDEYSYILFKNANNGSGQVKRKDEITNYTCISHGNLSEEQMNSVCKDLQEQLGNEYYVKKPEDNSHCIVIYTIEEWRKIK